MEIAKRYALLYGMSKYEESSGIPGLPAVKHNVERLRNTLPTWGFTIEHVRNPHLEQIISDLEDSADEVTGDDVFLLYLAGHAYLGRDSRDVFFPTRSTNDLGRRNQSLNFSEIIERLGNIRSRATVLIMDTCFSGGVSHLPRTLEITPAGNTLAILASSRLGRKSYIAEGGGAEPLSIYTGTILDIITGHDAGGAETVTLTQFADEVYETATSGPHAQEPRHIIAGWGAVPLLKRTAEPASLWAYGNRLEATAEETSSLAEYASQTAVTAPQAVYDGKFGSLKPVETEESSVTRTVIAEPRGGMLQAFARPIIPDEPGPRPRTRFTSRGRAKPTPPPEPETPDAD